jgi:hypothetical protein
MLAERKRELVNQINGFIEQKKAHGEAQVCEVEGRGLALFMWGCLFCVRSLFQSLAPI